MGGGGGGSGSRKRQLPRNFQSARRKTPRGGVGYLKRQVRRISKKGNLGGGGGSTAVLGFSLQYYVPNLFQTSIDLCSINAGDCTLQD